MTKLTIAGGGIGGLAAALACQRAGCSVTVLEQATAFADVGAGVQLGPNAVRLLDLWGLGEPLRQCAARPTALQVLNAANGRTMGGLTLGDTIAKRYGSDYLTIHRADLHQLLLGAVQQAGVSLQLQVAVKRWSESPQHLNVVATNNTEHTVDGLIGCDGVWSTVRQQLLRDGGPRSTGHLAYRTLIDTENVPAEVPLTQVTVWLGKDMHAVAYPVRGGSLLNLVVIVEGTQPGDPGNWNHQANGRALLKRMAGEHTVLQKLIDVALEWRLWVLHDRPPLRSPQAMAQGRVALLGDASHAMLPYLAQGAAMALEDAEQLGMSLQIKEHDVPAAWQHFANARWQRNAQVQEKSRRNGVIFHAKGPLRWVRNIAMKWGGEGLLDSPWLYGG